MTKLTAAAAHPGPGSWHEGEAVGWWPVFPITFGLFWLAVAIGAFYLLRRRAAPVDAVTGALSVVAERYARGEIDAEEYHARLAVLRESS